MAQESAFEMITQVIPQRNFGMGVGAEQGLAGHWQETSDSTSYGDAADPGSVSSLQALPLWLCSPGLFWRRTESPRGKTQNKNVCKLLLSNKALQRPKENATFKEAANPNPPGWVTGKIPQDIQGRSYWRRCCCRKEVSLGRQPRIPVSAFREPAERQGRSVRTHGDLGRKVIEHLQ